jgi:SNF2 family DNA or RNA helicase
MVWLFMSAGKTVISLTAIRERILRMEISRALVVAPKRVAESTWRQEARKWAHTQGLTVSLLRGGVDFRLRELFRPDVDVHVINYEMLPWLTKTCEEYFIRTGKPLPWQMLVLDEVDRFKDSQGKRLQQFENLLVPRGTPNKRQWAPDPDAPCDFTYRIGLTGTPASNGLVDLHGQFRAIDGGKRLYWFAGDFRQMFCRARGPVEYNQWEVMSPEAKAEVRRRVSDITLSLNEADHIQLPDYQFHRHWVDLPERVREAYEQFERDLFASLQRHDEDPQDGEWMILADSAPTAQMRCRQLANGAVKTPDGSTLVHDAKLEMLDQIVHEANGKPILVSYAFRADMHRIMERYKKLKPEYVGPGTKNADDIFQRWNKEEVKLLVSHPASIGHGLNLQDGGNDIVWFGPTNNPRLWLQFNARLRRQGQKAESVHVRQILARGTVDEPIATTLTQKNADEDKFRRALEDHLAKRALA